MKSIWSEEVEIEKRKHLSSGGQIEAVVIGAGMAGILTASLLQERDIEVIVLEANRIASGQTCHTTAKITSQHGLFYTDLVKKVGSKKAGLYAEANEKAILKYEDLVKKYGIECEFEKLPSYLYSQVYEDSLKQEADVAAELGIASYFTRENELPFPTAGAVCFDAQAQFHPLQFVKALAKQLKIYENTRVISVMGHVIETEHGKIEAEHIIFATHYPFINVPGFYFLRQHQERSYVIALSGEEKYHAMYYSADKGGVSLRSSKDYLLLGGGAHRTGEKDCQSGYRLLSEYATSYFPNCREEARWSAQDCMTHDDIPFIGRYSVYRPYWYVATGFKKWGMTSSMIAAEMITNLICGEENPYEAIFTPRRFYGGKATKNFLLDVGVSAKNLAKGVLQPKRRCPHMGCELVWNPEEKSWDCPCHGSRFDENGELIDNPAQKGTQGYLQKSEESK